MSVCQLMTFKPFCDAERTDMCSVSQYVYSIQSGRLDNSIPVAVFLANCLQLRAHHY